MEPKPLKQMSLLSSVTKRGYVALSLATLSLCLTSLTTPINHEPVTVSTDKATLKTSSSGVRYMVITQAPADSEKPKSGQKVVVHYTGWLDDNDQPGQKFDSSYDRNEPFSFNVGKGQVIKGWDESVLDMRVGEKRRVIIPPDLAYGSRGIRNVIPPNSTLIFDIEVIAIK